ncbi:hypothetical protein BIY45_01165 [Stenotrophomonas sp. BIIR7]|nr:hypothetical protein BIY45_01165 [Stenotrophomonas sp. BIIR7]
MLGRQEFDMPNIGSFYLFEVDCNGLTASGPEAVKVHWLYAQCTHCGQNFLGTCPPTLVNIPDGGTVVECPNCASRQAVAGQTFVDFMARFPTGFSGPVPAP